MTATIQDTRVSNKKSGLGNHHGVKSEATALLTVKPGHADELRAACQRFVAVLKKAPFKALQHFGLHYTRLAVVDNGTRLIWLTAFDTDFAPYVDDSVNQMGVGTWYDWLQHCTECPEGFEHFTGPQVREVIQRVQTTADGYFEAFPDLTMGEIKKGERLSAALEQVLEQPEGVAALQNPALKPLLEEAAG
jgi:hypothetical protein